METPSASKVTRLLMAWRDGQEEALDQLMPLIYQELKQLARGYLRGERPDHTLQPTALIHEAYLRLADQRLPQWQNRAHFYGIAARVMRQILVDHARRHQASKRGSDQQRVTLDKAIVFTDDRAADVVALDDALKELATFDERKCRVIELRFFGGLSLEETAEALGISIATVGRELRLASAWLHRQMSDSVDS
ncbi:MAG TPA: sigma-70 family RNA polymerase sigma factor [Thermoanaerobaculia bacterium]|nr:sigma-70 family RNA polymerase sigma factor [Thermoanaerobaculia bacterium]